MKQFIGLTTAKNKRPIYVRAEFVASFVEHINDDEGKRCTRVWMSHGLTLGDEPLEVAESPERILMQLEKLTTERFQAGEIP